MNEFPFFLKELDPHIYLSDDYLPLDFETDNIDFGSALVEENKIILGVYGKDKSVYNASKDFPSEMLARVKKCKFIVAQNAKFELQWLYRLGIEPGSVLVFDTMLAEYVLRGNLRGPLDLDSLCKEHGLEGKESVVSRWLKAGISPRNTPYYRLENYCKQDTQQTEQLFLIQRRLLEERRLLPVFFTRCLTTLVLADIERPGMCLDKELVEKEYRDTSEKSRELLAELDGVTGGINPKSPKQVAEFLYDNLKFEELTNRNGEPERTASGRRKTDEATIAALRAETPEQQRFSDLIRSYSPIKKRLETLSKFWECVSAGDLLHAQFNQSVTSTHRLSSSGRKYKVQFQNVDRDLKKLFVARNKGWKVASADAKQLEFRVAIHLSGDKQGHEDIRNGVDVHLNSAAAIFNKAKEKVTKNERTDAKKVTFRPLFGGSSGSPELRKYCKWFQNHYNGLYRAQEGWANEVAIHKKYCTPSGLIFYWPQCTIDSKGYVSNKTEIFNYKIQSYSTADIIPIVLIYQWYRMKIAGLESFVVNTVHDSIVTELKPEEAEVWEEITKQAFTTDVCDYLSTVYEDNFTVPLGVSYDISDKWGIGEDKEWEYDPLLV